MHLAHYIKDVQDKGTVPRRDNFPAPNTWSGATGHSGATGGAASSSSGAPSANAGTNVSNQTAAAADTNQGAADQAADVQADTMGTTAAAPILDVDEPIESWMARQQLWVYTPTMSEVMISLGVTRVTHLVQYVYLKRSAEGC